MQEQLASAQERLAETVVDGTVAGGAVTVQVNGVGELVGSRSRPAASTAATPDDLSDLGDMIVAAYRDAKGPGRRPRRRGARSPGRRGCRRDPAGPGQLGFWDRCTRVVQDLIDELGRLPGVGPKSAQRIAFHLLQADPVDVRRLADVLVEVKAR